MELLSIIALAALTMVGYSSGTASRAKGQQSKPTLLDLLLVAVLISGAFYVRPQLGKWMSILVGVLAGAAFGALASGFRMSEATLTPAPDQVRLRERFVAFLHEVGNFQGRLLIGYFYFVVVTPFALLGRFARDPLDIKRPTSGVSSWKDRPAEQVTLEAARRQF